MTATTLPPGCQGEIVAPPPNNKRDRRLWLAARKNGLGASEVATILGLAPTGWKTSPLKIWLDKTSPDIDEGEVTERMEWGTELEAPVIRVFARRHAKELGIRVAPNPGLLRHPDHPWMLATPDRLGVGLRSKVAEAVIEAKTSDAMMRKEWDEGAPFHYAIQVQCQLAVTGLARAYLVPLFGGNYMPEPYVVERDDIAIGQIIEFCGQWWERYVLGREMPPPEVGDLSELPKVWPGHPDESLCIPPDDPLVAKVAERARLWACKTSDEARVAELDLDIKTAMADSKYLTDWDGNILATWSRFPQRRLDKDAMLRDRPDLRDVVAQYTTPRPSGRFTITAPTEET